MVLVAALKTIPAGLQAVARLHPVKDLWPRPPRPRPHVPSGTAPTCAVPPALKGIVARRQDASPDTTVAVVAVGRGPPATPQGLWPRVFRPRPARRPDRPTVGVGVPSPEEVGPGTVAPVGLVDPQLGDEVPRP